jgi:hypothetical protein
LWYKTNHTMNDPHATPPEDHVNSNEPGAHTKAGTMSVALRDQLQQRAVDAETRVEELRLELEAERSQTDDERLAEASKLIEMFKEIADHAVANLRPEYIKDIPAEAFDKAADLIPVAVGGTQRDTERAIVWHAHARDAYEWRDKRKARAWEGTPPSTPSTVAPVRAPSKLKDIKLAAKALGYGLVKLVLPAAKKIAGRKRATGRKGQGRSR